MLQQSNKQYNFLVLWIYFSVQSQIAQPEFTHKLLQIIRLAETENETEVHFI